MSHPFQKTSGPIFPLAALPEWLGVYVADVAASFQVPLNMPAAFALGVLATAGAGKARMNPFGDWMEPLNLFIALIAPPGAKKSGTVDAFLAPLTEFERELAERAKPQLRAQRVERERIETQLAAAKKTGDWSEVERLEEELESAPEPVAPRLTADAVTAQKLTSLLTSHRRMAIISAEPSIFATMLGRWSSGAAELDVFLKGHAGDAIKVDRLGRASESVERPCLTMAIALQPNALMDFNRPDTAGRGLLARFLWVTAPDLRGTLRQRDARPIPDTHRADFRRGLRAILELETTETVLHLDSDAQSTWEGFVDGFERRLAKEGDARNLSGWGEKLRGMVARVAGLLHLAEHGQQGTVSLDTVSRAIVIGEWAVEHAKVVFDIMGMVPDRQAARAILEIIREEGVDVVTRRYVHQHLKDRKAFRRSSSLTPGFDLLIQEGWLTRQGSEPKRGRPSVSYAVNPEVLDSERFEGLSGTGEAA